MIPFMSLSYCFRSFLDSWLNPEKQMFFIRPSALMFNARTKVAASKLTASEVEGAAHFYVRDIKNVEGHVGSSTVSEDLRSMVTRRLMEKKRLLVFIKECVSQIVERRSRLRYCTIPNETGFRYVYGDSIADMLVDGLHYSMQFEECVETSETTVTPTSRTDYCCWRLF